MGGAIYDNLFKSRSHFLDYAQDFETPLQAAQAIKSGPGVLVFCGTGFAWHKSNLEDFADFYRTGIHRSDDLFGPMEAESIKRKKIELLRNISEFAWLRTPHRGPAAGGVSFSDSRAAHLPSSAETLAACRRAGIRHIRMMKGDSRTGAT
jgi:hypothetical protein